MERRRDTVEVSIGSCQPLTHEGHGLNLGLWVNDVLMVLFFFVVDLGKPIGITLFSWVAIKLGVASLPARTSIAQADLRRRPRRRYRLHRRAVRGASGL